MTGEDVLNMDAEPSSDFVFLPTTYMYPRVATDPATAPIAYDLWMKFVDQADMTSKGGTWMRPDEFAAIVDLFSQQKILIAQLDQ